MPFKSQESPWAPPSPPLLTFLKQSHGMLTIRSVASMLDCTCNLGNLLFKATISMGRKAALSSSTPEKEKQQ